MSDQLLLDFERAFDLHVTMTGVADEIDHDRTALAGLLTDAARFTTADTGDVDVRLRSLTDLLRTEADDLARRLRMVALGGPEINAGLAALEDLRDAWDVIDNKGDTDGPNSSDRDGVVSRSDLEWAAEHLDGDAARAARWLLDHPEFFAAVETAKHNTDYLADGGAGFAADSDETDGKLSLDDVDAYITKLDTWATLVPYMATIDVAAHGGELDGVMSKGDFEAFLDDQSLPPQVRQAAQTVLDDSAYHDTGGIGWDDVLMVASFIPIVGDFVDGAMALYYLSQGDWEQAALSGIGLLPIPGMTGGTVRGAKAAAGEAAEELVQRTARESIDDLAEGVAASGRRTDGAVDYDDLDRVHDIAPSSAVPDVEDVTEVPVMSGARHADEVGGPPPTGGGSPPAPPKPSRSGDSGGGARSGDASPSDPANPTAELPAEPHGPPPPNSPPPTINPQQQAGHVAGTPQYVNRVKQGKPTSVFEPTENADSLTRYAWEHGAPTANPNIRILDFQRRIGTGFYGGGQTQVRVSINSRGEIHGSPWGPELP